MNRIKEIREVSAPRQIGRKISQEELALASVPPTSAQQISRLENGERRLDTKWMERISNGFMALGLNVCPVDLLPMRHHKERIDKINELLLELDDKRLDIVETLIQKLKL